MFDFPKKELDASKFIVCSNNSLSQFVHVTTILSQYVQSQCGGHNLGGSRRHCVPAKHFLDLEFRAVADVLLHINTPWPNEGGVQTVNHKFSLFS